MSDFVGRLGYEANEAGIKFCLYSLIRSELICWDGSRGRRLIENVPFRVATPGIIAIRRMLKSITYVSEAIISSLHTDLSLTRHFRDRADSPQVWVADCISNASIALLILRKIEQAEKRSASKNLIDFVPYLVVDDMQAALQKEAEAILKRHRTKTHSRWEQNANALRALAKDEPTLCILGSLE